MYSENQRILPIFLFVYMVCVFSLLQTFESIHFFDEDGRKRGHSIKHMAQHNRSTNQTTALTVVRPPSIIIKFIDIIFTSFFALDAGTLRESNFTLSEQMSKNDTYSEIIEQSANK
jgi:hypothetical protein